jgi:hypothetical protein
MLAAMERFAGIAGMILIACGAMFARSVALSSQPIQIVDCRIRSHHSLVAPFGAVGLSFVNRGSVVVSKVRFRIVYDGQIADSPTLERLPRTSLFAIRSRHFAT